jgi:hypothetical protein
MNLNYKIMPTYEIKFKTLDGNENSVLIDAMDFDDAELKFERQYNFDEIISNEEFDCYDY